MVRRGLLPTIETDLVISDGRMRHLHGRLRLFCRMFEESWSGNSDSVKTVVPRAVLWQSRDLRPSGARKIGVTRRLRVPRRSCVPRGLAGDSLPLKGQRTQGDFVRKPQARPQLANKISAIDGDETPSSAGCGCSVHRPNVIAKKS
jgi:hypothetical protein